MGVRREGQEGALGPPWPAKIVWFSTFLKGIFQANSMFLPMERLVCVEKKIS